MGSLTLTELPHRRMRRRLSESVAAPIWPDGVHLVAFAESAATEVHALLELAYADSEGSVSSFEQWWPSLAQDSEYDPTLCFLACDSAGSLVGFAQCWLTAFVKDLVVHPRYRRRGIGRALLLHIFSVFQQRGFRAVDLKVLINNPSGALQFYESLGMFQIPN
jgi:ribosomal protein S18 acetylase RimI-like enzyme